MAACSTVDQRLAEALAARKRTALLSRKRADATRAVKALKRERSECRGTKSKGKGRGRGKGAELKTPGTIGGRSPEQLWETDPQKRPIGLLGLATGMLGGEDMIVDVARGARTSLLNRAADDRATIRGGLSVLAQAGHRQVNVEKLSSKLVQGKQQDAALIKAAGGGGSLRGAADRVRAEVVQAGLARAAWGARGLYLLANVRGMHAVRGTVAGVVSLVFPIGTVIGAAMAVHGAVTGQLARAASAQFSRFVAEGLERAQAKQPTPGAFSPAGGPPSSGLPWYAWAGGAVALVAGAALLRGSR